MAKIYQFPFEPELNEEQKLIFDKEIQELLDMADKEADKITAYICDPPSDNPFEQMERERLYNEFWEGLDKMSSHAEKK